MLKNKIVLKKITKLAVKYFQNFILPTLKKRKPNLNEKYNEALIMKSLAIKKN